MWRPGKYSGPGLSFLATIHRGRTLGFHLRQATASVLTAPQTHACKLPKFRQLHHPSSADKFPGAPKPRKTLKPGTLKPPKPLPPPSPEQARAIDTFKSTRDNITVIACAGSGKTTTYLHLAKEAPTQQFLVVPYNNRLMSEAADRAASLGLDNIRVINFHAPGVRLYSRECSRDEGLKRVVQDDMPILKENLFPVDVIVVDEMQHMTPILTLFLRKLLRDMGITKDCNPEKPVRFVGLGDPRQELDGHNGCDSRFLTMAQDRNVFGYLNDECWVSIDQPTSNRVTSQTAKFITQQLLKPPHEKIFGARETDINGRSYPRPLYVILDAWKDICSEKVRRILQGSEAQAEEIMALAPSVRADGPIKRLANELALLGYPIHLADSEDGAVSPNVSKGKILFGPYHEAKGIERKVVLVAYFDASYEWFHKDTPTLTAATNAQHVAITRATEQLVVLHDFRREPLPFVDMSTLGDTCDVIKMQDHQPEKLKNGARRSNFSVTDLTRNTSEMTVTKCIQLLDLQSISPPMHGPIPDTEVEDVFGLQESVSEITESVIPAIYEYRCKGTCKLLSLGRNLLKKRSRGEWGASAICRLPLKYYEKIEDIKLKRKNHIALNESDILYLGNLYMSSLTGYIYKILSIPIHGYNWLTSTHADDIFFTLRQYIPKTGVEYEHSIERFFPNVADDGGRGITVQGIADICRLNGQRTVWEIRYTPTLQAIHLIQAALYALIMEATEPAKGPVECLLISAQSGQVVKISPKTKTSYLEILQILVAAKSDSDKSQLLLNTVSDSEFLEACHDGFKGFVGPVVLPEWFSAQPTSRKAFQAPGKVDKEREGLIEGDPGQGKKKLVVQGAE